MNYDSLFKNYVIIENKLNNKYNINENIIKKINFIFTSYECFYKQFNKFNKSRDNFDRLNYNYQNNSNRNYKKKYNNYKFNKKIIRNNKNNRNANINYNVDVNDEKYKQLEQSILNQIKNKKDKPKTDKNKILSLLNKISSQNYEKLSKQILDEFDLINFISNNNNLNNNNKIIIDSLFEVSYKQTNFTNLYIFIYSSILVKNKFSIKYFNELLENNENLNIILNNLSNYNYIYLIELINKFLNNSNNYYDNQDNNEDDNEDDNEDEWNLIFLNKSLNENKLENSESYEIFCKNNKKIKLFKGKIFVIIYLIKNNIIHKEFTKILIDKIYQYEDFMNDIFLDILHMYHYHIKLTNDKLNDLKIFTKSDLIKKNLKLKFKIYDILDNKNYILN